MDRHKMSSLRVLACVAMFASVLASAPALALAQGGAASDDKRKKKTGISGILGDMDWLASDVEVLTGLETAVKAQYRDKIAETRDTFKIDRLMRERRAKFKEIKDTLTRFDGQRTGYETSLIAQDYLPNDGESVIRVDDTSAQRYYFFKHGRLWKVVVAYHSSVTRAMSFAGFVKQVQSKYGPAASRQTEKIDGKKALVAAVWEDELTQLTVENRTGFFGTYVMKFINKTEGLTHEAARADRKLVGTSTAGDAKADSLMADIAGGPSEEMGEDVVDRLTGVEHGVDLTAGRTFNKPLVRASDRPSTPKAQPRKAAPAAEPKRTARGDNAKSSAADDPDTSSVDPTGSDVIIY